MPPTHLYINGTFSLEWDGRAPVFYNFHGYIGPKWRRKPRDGYMLDEDGKSDITDWRLDGKLLTFTKQYHHMNFPVTFHLEEEAPSVYFGKWEFRNGEAAVTEGKVRLITTLIPKSFFEGLASLYEGE